VPQSDQNEVPTLTEQQADEDICIITTGAKPSTIQKNLLKNNDNSDTFLLEERDKLTYERVFTFANIEDAKS